MSVFVTVETLSFCMKRSNNYCHRDVTFFAQSGPIIGSIDPGGQAYAS